MTDFSNDIQNFKRYGTYIYKFDNVGNIIFNLSSSNFNQVYVAFPLVNPIYDNSKIEMMYNVEFEEFIPKSTTINSTSSIDLQQQLETAQSQNELLKTQLDSLISNNTNNNNNSEATKQVILELRKSLGEGVSDIDFSESFPYTAIRKNIS